MRFRPSDRRPSTAAASPPKAKSGLRLAKPKARTQRHLGNLGNTGNRSGKTYEELLTNYLGDCSKCGAKNVVLTDGLCRDCWHGRKYATSHRAVLRPHLDGQGRGDPRDEVTGVAFREYHKTYRKACSRAAELRRKGRSARAWKNWEFGKHVGYVVIWKKREASS